MKSLVKYLRQHLVGDVLAGEEVLRFASRDASLLQIKPAAVIVARHEDDVRKTLLILKQLASRGRIIPLTVRGGGTDLSGACLGEGLILLLPLHWHKIIKSDRSRGIYRFQAGASIESIRKMLEIETDFLPAVDDLPGRATIGGAVANNASSRYSLKYGLIENQVEALKVILSNGEVIEPKLLSRSELKDKIKLDTLEGDIYRGLEKLFNVEDSPYYYKGGYFNQAENRPDLPGLNIGQLYREDGGVNLKPLFFGSQGTLGVISEVEFYAQDRKDSQSLVFICSGFKMMLGLVENLRDLRPASMSFINSGYLAASQHLQANKANSPFSLKSKEVALIIEFDDKIKKKIKKALKAAHLFEAGAYQPKTPAEVEQLAGLRMSLKAVYAEDRKESTYVYGGLRHVHIPHKQLSAFWRQVRFLFSRWQLDLIAFGEIGLESLSVLPNFDLQTLSQRKKLLKFLDEYHSLVFAHQGRPSLERQEGLLLNPFLKKTLSELDYKLISEIKNLFDPYGILNPKAKFNPARDYIAGRLQPGTDLSSSFSQRYQLN